MATRIPRPDKFRSYNAAQAWHEAMMALSGKVDLTRNDDSDAEQSAIEEDASRKAPDDKEAESLRQMYGDDHVSVSENGSVSIKFESIEEFNAITNAALAPVMAEFCSDCAATQESEPDPEDAITDYRNIRGE